MDSDLYEDQKKNISNKSTWNKKIFYLWFEVFADYSDFSVCPLYNIGLIDVLKRFSYIEEKWPQ